MAAVEDSAGGLIEGLGPGPGSCLLLLLLDLGFGGPGQFQVGGAVGLVPPLVSAVLGFDDPAVLDVQAHVGAGLFEVGVEVKVELPGADPVFGQFRMVPLVLGGLVDLDAGLFEFGLSGRKLGVAFRPAGRVPDQHRDLFGRVGGVFDVGLCQLVEDRLEIAAGVDHLGEFVEAVGPYPAGGVKVEGPIGQLEEREPFRHVGFGPSDLLGDVGLFQTVGFELGVAAGLLDGGEVFALKVGDELDHGPLQVALMVPDVGGDLPPRRIDQLHGGEPAVTVEDLELTVLRGGPHHDRLEEPDASDRFGKLSDVAGVVADVASGDDLLEGDVGEGCVGLGGGHSSSSAACRSRHACLRSFLSEA